MKTNENEDNPLCPYISHMTKEEGGKLSLLAGAIIVVFLAVLALCEIPIFREWVLDM